MSLPVLECPRCSREWQMTGDGRVLCPSCGYELVRCPECIQWKPADEFEELIICRSAVGFYVCRECYEKIFK